MENRKDNCPFCKPDQFLRPHFEEFGVPGLDKAVLIETDNFIVVPDLLPVVPADEGVHILVCSKSHRCSLGECFAAADEIGGLAYNLEQKFGQPLVIAEHGGFQDGNNTQSVYHAHAHIVTKNGKGVLEYMGDDLINQGIVYTSLENLDPSIVLNLCEINPHGEGYLFVQSERAGLLAEDIDGSFPSQITQRALSRLLSGCELNWKEIPVNGELAKLSVQRVVNLVSKFV
jgi:hypothetical protein